jgi:hypothetical protein
MPWAPSSTLPGGPPHTSQGVGSTLDLSSGGWIPIRAGALYLAVEAGCMFPDRSRAEVTHQRYSPETIAVGAALVFKEPQVSRRRQAGTLLISRACYQLVISCMPSPACVRDRPDHAWLILIDRTAESLLTSYTSQRPPKPTQANPSQPKSTQVNPSQPKPAQVNPSQPKSTQANPSQPKPTQGQPAHTHPPHAYTYTHTHIHTSTHTHT